MWDNTTPYEQDVPEQTEACTKSGICQLNQPPPPLPLQFCSDPVSLAIAEAVLTTIEEEGLQENAKRLGTYIMDGVKRLMEKHPCIGEVR